MRQRATIMTGTRQPGLLGQLARDTSGNTLAMIAAAVLPLLAMVGGGIDMGRSYLSQTRLQQACDAGVLAARKKLGPAVVTDGQVPADVATVGNQFFNVNFLDGSYGTENRDFAMTLEQDYAISGAATVDVPTTIMTLFGYSNVPITVNCEAKLNFSNTDIMFVLDTTGSMGETNPSDSAPRIDGLRDVVKTFHAQVEGSKGAGTRVRYGFVPYATNVNVGGLLKSDWMVDEWAYQSRVAKTIGTNPGSSGIGWFTVSSTVISGSADPIASYTAASCPSSTYNSTLLSQTPIAPGPPRNYDVEYRENGNYYSCSSADGVITVSGTDYKNRVVRYHIEERPYTNPPTPIYGYDYDRYQFDVSGAKDPDGDQPTVRWATITANTYSDTSPSTYWYEGCIEERSTYEITDYDNVDLTRALDLDLDRIPDKNDPETQWRPIYRGIAFDRSIYWDGSGSWTLAPVIGTQDDYIVPDWTYPRASCPTAARKLEEMNNSDVANYVDNLVVDGATYHDIGMIWGGRLLSPTGLFADDNGDIDGKPTARHMIFLTDGLTAPLDILHSSYGVEPLDQRRWSEASALSLAETVEERFGAACKEVKKRNITVWVIGFGTTLNPIMTDCAGPGKSFEATDTAELNDIFSRIAASIGDLRISK